MNHVKGSISMHLDTEPILKKYQNYNTRSNVNVKYLGNVKSII